MVNFEENATDNPRMWVWPRGKKLMHTTVSICSFIYKLMRLSSRSCISIIHKDKYSIRFIIFTESFSNYVNRLEGGGYSSAYKKRDTIQEDHIQSRRSSSFDILSVFMRENQFYIRQAFDFYRKVSRQSKTVWKHSKISANLSVIQIWFNFLSDYISRWSYNWL